MPDVEAVVVGAGIAGLAAARSLQQEGFEVVTLDAGESPGGVFQTARREGYLFERGPNTCRVTAPMRRFLEELNLLRELVPAAPVSRSRFLVREGRLEPVPGGPIGFVTTPLLSARGKLRLLAEPFVRRGDATAESVAEFVTRRLGPEVSDALVAPFLLGIYAGDERRLGAEAVFPGLVGFERTSGSIVRGALSSLRRREAGLAGSYSLPDGFAALAAGLAGTLGERLLLGTRVAATTRDGDAWRVEAEGRGEAFRTRRLVMAIPAYVAADLLASVDSDLASGLASIEYAPIVSAPVGLDPRRGRVAVDGFGFLVPRTEGLDLLGGLFTSQLFPGRAPPGRELVMAILGGVGRRDLLDLDDGSLRAVVERDVGFLLGIDGVDDWLGPTRWARAIPQPGPGHRGLVADLRRRLPPGLALAGGYLDGVSVADALVSGLSAAAAVRAAPSGVRSRSRPPRRSR